MIRNLPQASTLGAFLKSMPNVEAKDAHTIVGAVKAVEDCKDIRPEFHRVLEGFLRASIKRFEIKRTRGHNYSEYTSTVVLWSPPTSAGSWKVRVSCRGRQ